MDEDTIRRAVAPVLVNAMRYPEKVQVHILGQDMTPLIDAVVAKVMQALAEEDSEPYVATLTVRSRHLKDYLLINTADGSRWRATPREDGSWTWMQDGG